MQNDGKVQILYDGATAHVPEDVDLAYQVKNHEVPYADFVRDTFGAHAPCPWKPALPLALPSGYRPVQGPGAACFALLHQRNGAKGWHAWVLSLRCEGAIEAWSCC